MSAPAKELPRAKEVADPSWGIKPQPESMPEELKRVPAWVLWRAVHKPNGKVDKRPYQPNGSPAKVNDRSTWSTFDEAVRAYGNGTRYNGLGFVMGGIDRPMIGVDIDNCRDPDNGDLDDRAKELVDAMPTYVEVSPSGTGIRAFMHGDLGEFSKDGVEIYNQDSGRYLTLTGVQVNDWIGSQVGAVTPAFKRAIAKYRQVRETSATSTAEKIKDTPDQIRRILLDMDLTQVQGYHDWLNLGMALHHQFDGSDEGLDLWDECSQVMDNYDGREVLESKWESFGGGAGRQVTLRTFLAEAKAQGVNIHSAVSADDFPDLGVEIVDATDTPLPSSTRDPLGRLLDLDRVVQAVPAESIVQGLVRRKELLLITGKPKSGKTFYAMHMARCVASGEPFFGHKTCPPSSEPKSVLYLAFESQPAIEARLRAWSAAGIDIPVERLHVLGDIRVRLNQGKDFAREFRALAEGIKFDVVFVDTFLAASAGADINSMAEVTELLRILDLIARAYRCAVVIVHHTPKSGSSNSLGSQALPAGVDATIVVDKGGGESRPTGLHTATGDDVRNGPAGGSHGFTLRGIKTGLVDEFGDPEEAAYLVEYSGRANPNDFPNEEDETTADLKPLTKSAADLKKRILAAIDGCRSGSNFMLEAGGWATVSSRWASRWMPEKVQEENSDARAVRDAGKNAISSALKRAVSQLQAEHEHRAAGVTLDFERNAAKRVVAVIVHKHDQGEVAPVT